MGVVPYGPEPQLAHSHAPLTMEADVVDEPAGCFQLALEDTLLLVVCSLIHPRGSQTKQPVHAIHGSLNPSTALKPSDLSSWLHRLQPRLKFWATLTCLVKCLWGLAYVSSAFSYQLDSLLTCLPTGSSFKRVALCTPWTPNWTHLTRTNLYRHFSHTWYLLGTDLQVDDGWWIDGRLMDDWWSIYRVITHGMDKWVDRKRYGWIDG